MIPRHQVVLFVVLAIASIIMVGTLWHLRDRAHQKMLAGQDSAPTQAPLVTPAESATLVVASDNDGSLSPQTQSLPLSQDPGARIRAILGKLMDIYAADNAAHPVPGGDTSIAQVFLMPTATAAPAQQSGTRAVVTTFAATSGGTQLAGPQTVIVNLTKAFADGHPAGLETETLTILSICATIHSNMPQVTEVRFLVDGQQRATLAGHADLTRTYLTANTTPEAGRQ